MSLRLIRGVFNEILNDTVRQFTRTLRNREAEHMSQKIHQMFDHCMGNGKFGRSCLALDTYKALKPDATEIQLHQAAKISSSLELLQTFFLVLDDIMDGSQMRRGKTCWYKMPGIGMNAINHGLQLDLAMNQVIWSEMRNHPKLHQMLHDVHETKTITVIGQELDCATQGPNDCTWDRYEQLVHHKTCHYTFTMPVRMGFHMADRLGYESLTPLTYKIGYLFQAQDDYLDCFGCVDVTGKNSTDLAEGKCTWFSCKTMELLNANSNDSIRQDFIDNFGKSTPENVEKALGVMRQLNVSQLFREFEDKQIKDIEREISEVETEEVKPILENLIRAMHGRKL